MWQPVDMYVYTYLSYDIFGTTTALLFFSRNISIGFPVFL